MTATNLWKRLKQLLPDDPLLVGEIIGSSAYNKTVQLPDGSLLTARGSGNIGDNVFVRGGTIEGPAPNLSTVLIEI